MAPQRRTTSEPTYGGLYSDRVESEGKSVKSRIEGGSAALRSTGIRNRISFKASVGRKPAGTRLSEGEADGKWKHDMYEVTGSSVSGNDLRARLQRKAELKQKLRPRVEGTFGAATRDLRDHLSGPIRSSMVFNAAAERELEKPRRLTVVVQNDPELPLRRKSAKPSAAAAAAMDTDDPDVKNEKSDMAAFLQSLGLEKYVGKFQAEEIDMSALRQMSEDDLKELGVPMGPRKKILQSIPSG